MTSEQFQLHLCETLQDLTDYELAVIYENYLDDATMSLTNGLLTECHRRGITLNHLEDLLQ